MKKKGNLLLGLMAVAMIAVAAVWMLGDDLEHIEDTNGTDNYALQTITGESADFTFSLDRLFCERYDITIGE